MHRSSSLTLQSLPKTNPRIAGNSPTPNRIRLIVLLLAAVTLQTFAQDSGQKTSIDNSGCRWNVFSYPTTYNLTALRMSGKGEGFLAEKNLMHFSNGQWSVFEKQPPIVNIYKLDVTGRHDIWVVDILHTFESELCHFDGTRWNQVYHPLANEIDALHFRPDGTGWIGGSGEIAYFNGKGWNLFVYPPSRTIVKRIYGVSATQVWVLTSKGELFSLVAGRWKQLLTEMVVRDIEFQDESHGYAVCDGKVFEWKDSHWIVHSTDELLKEISKVSVVKNGEIWGIGPRGFVVHYDGAKWSKVLLPTDVQLTDIQMLSEQDGWIVGEDGIVLHYSSQVNAGSSRPDYGFEPVQIAPFAKEINDEYGVAIEDFNNDGLNDVFAVCMYDPDRLYVNVSSPPLNKEEKVFNLRFSEEAVPRGLTGLTKDVSAVGYSKISLGVGVADVDNDGNRDIYICYLAGPNKLFLNNGNGFFRDVSDEPRRACGLPGRWNAAVFGDVNNDGYVDLFVTNEESSNRLYLNDGTGHFTDVTEQAGLTTTGGGMGASFGDIDGDGRLDLCVANWTAPNRLYRNVSTVESGVKFVDITESAGIGGEPYAKSNAVVFADVNNDGALDLFITSRKRSNRLYINDGTGKFTDRTAGMIGIDSMLSYGASFADFDNDGYLDLFVANVGECVLYRNVAGKRFVPATDQFGAQLRGYCTGTATGDIDNDGDIDLYVGVFINGSSTLFVNKLNNKNFLSIDVGGTQSNRDAIGAKVSLYRDGCADNKECLLGFREINGGSGYGSESSKQVHFGVRGDQSYDIVVFFPASGIKKILRSVAAGQHLTIREEDGLRGSVTLFSKSLRRLIIDPETHTEAAKFAFVLAIVTASAFAARKRYQWKAVMQCGFHGSVLLLYWIQIALFLHEKILLSTILPISSVIIVLAIVHLLFDRVIMVRIAQQEKQATRDGIARDLHDDIASTLSSALIYVDVLRRSSPKVPRRRQELLEKIAELLTESSNALTDIVWAMAHRDNSLWDLLRRLRVQIADACEVHSMTCNLGIAVADSGIELPDRIQRNLYLIFKEGIANIIKHAKASSVSFAARMNHGFLEMQLKDNGSGFLIEEQISNSTMNPQENAEPPSALHGHGLQNMMSRAHEIGATLKIESEKGKGTTLSLSIKMT